MILPLRLLALELRQSRCYKHYLQYLNTIDKVENNSLRIKFLDNCKRSDVIPKFLKFRIPNNGCFDKKSVHNFQRQLLTKELHKAKSDLQKLNSTLYEKRRQLKAVIPEKCLPSVVVYSRISRHNTRREQSRKHNHIIFLGKYIKSMHNLKLKTHNIYIRHTHTKQL